MAYPETGQKYELIESNPTRSLQMSKQAAMISTAVTGVLALGAQFPAIRAIYEGQEINDIEQFFGDKGAVFLAMRSVDW